MKNYKELFKGLEGQDFAIQILKSALQKDRIANAYLFSGPKGVGRKKTALRFIEGIINNDFQSPDLRRKIDSLNVPDLLWVEPTYINQGKIIPKSQSDKENIAQRASPQIRLDQIKQVKTFLGKKPLELSKSIVVIEEVESMNESSSNALLKTLEEPNQGIFILITNRSDRLLKTIISRCQIIPFLTLSQNKLKKVLKDNDNILEIKDCLLESPNELLDLANGSPGELIKNLQSWSEIPNHIISELKRMPQDSLSNLTLAKEITEELNLEQQVWIINWLQNFLWLKENKSKPIQRLEKLKSQLFSFVQPRLAWEIALLEMNLLSIQ